MGGELRLYDVTVGSHKTRMRLNDPDAEAMGDAAVLVPEHAATHPTPATPAGSSPEAKSRLVTSNKMRGSHNPVNGESTP